MHALRHLAVVKAQQKEFAVAMDVRDAADRLCEDQRLRAERGVLDDPRSISDIAALLAKQGRELGALRARHRATRARLDRETRSWGARGVFFPGPESVDETETEADPAASSPAPRARCLAPAPAVTPSWGAFRTPAGVTRRHAGTATKAFLEAGGVRFEFAGARGVSSRVPEAEDVFPRAIRALDFDVSDAGRDAIVPRGRSPRTAPRGTPRVIDEPSERCEPSEPRDSRHARPASVRSRFGRRGTWLRRPSATAKTERVRSSSSPETATKGSSKEDPTSGTTQALLTTGSGMGSQTGSVRAVSLAIPRLALPKPGEGLAEREDWRAVSLGAPADVAPPTAADDWRSLAMMRARDPETRAAAARAYGEYRDALGVVSVDANDPNRGFTNRGFARARAVAETRRAPFLGRRDASYASDRVGLDDRERAQDEAWTRRGPTGPTGRRAQSAEKENDEHENDDDALVWTRRGASFRRAAGVGAGADASPVAVDETASFAHEALRPLDDERIRREDARLRAGGGAKGRLPTGDFFELRRGAPASGRRAGAAPTPSTRTKDATPISAGAKGT